MGHLERLQNEFNGTLEDNIISDRCQDIKRNIFREWQTYIRREEILHGRNIKGSEVDQLIFYLVKKGIIKN